MQISDSPPQLAARQVVSRGLRRGLRPRTRLVEGWAKLHKARFGVRPLHNLLIDLWFGGWCGGRFENPFTAEGAFPIQSVDYAALSTLHQRNRITIRSDDVLVDVGCGRGRVLNWWLSRGFPNRLIGLELVPEVAVSTARRLRRHANVSIRTGEATAHLPPEGTFFFLYSPFDRQVMTRFRDQVWSEVRRLDDLRILYFNSRFLDVFRDDPRWHIRTLETGEPEPAALILPA